MTCRISLSEMHVKGITCFSESLKIVKFSSDVRGCPWFDTANE